jgi:hypothetical protein
MKIVSKYFSDDLTKKSVVWNLDGIPVVEFFDRDVKLETRALVEHSFEYAEDAAENFVIGVLKI